MITSIDKILKQGIEKFGLDDYIFEKEEGNFKSYTYKEFYEDVLKFTSFFYVKGLKNKKIALYAENSYNYMVADIAIMAYTGICVSMVQQWKSEDIKNIINEIGIDAIIYDKSRQVIIDELETEYKNIEYISFDDLKNLQVQKEIDLTAVDIEKCSKIVFSSGTTGEPKAVMLSQKNMFANVDNLFRRAAMDSSDSCYLFLPLAHTYGGIGNFLYSLISGMKIYICRDKTKIIEEIKEVRPSLFSAVPLVLNKVYEYAVSTATSIQEILGGNIKYLFCGGAFLEPRIRKYIKDEGVNLLEAYGLSETTSLISLEYSYNKDDFDSVGTIFENQIVRIDEPDANGIGEITVKGDNIFIGYYNREDLYKSVFDELGYFHTGDIGYVKENKLYLVGRKKRVIIKPNARNIYPEELEALLLERFDVDAVKIYEKQDKLHCSLYSNRLNYSKELLEEINSHLPKYAKMNSCEVIKNNLSTKLK